MANLDEIFAAMPAAAAEADREYLVIDPVTRTITVPESERIFGVTGDELADRKYFMCPRYVGDGLDLAGMFIRVNYRNAAGDEDGYLVEDVAVAGDYVTFSWRLWPKVTEYMGAIQFGVCADLPNTTERRFPDWNTTMASGEVLEGLHPYDGAVEEETRDVVTQLRAETAAQTAAVAACGAEQVQAVQDAATAATAAAEAQVAAKGAETLATIPEDYTTLANKTNEQANAIKGHLAGEIVQAGDVSPVEHYLGVKVHGKNLMDVTKIAVQPIANPYISAVGEGVVEITTAAGYAGNGHCQSYITLRELCPQIVPGKRYVLSAETTAASKMVHLRSVDVFIYFGAPVIITEEMLSATVGFYGLDARYDPSNTGACVISNIQLEEGDVATEYTPYIDPAGVTVTRCGENLANSANLAEYSEGFFANVTLLESSEDGKSITVHGAAGASENAHSSGWLVLNYGKRLNLKAGDEVTISADVTLVAEGIYGNTMKFAIINDTAGKTSSSAELTLGGKTRHTATRVAQADGLHRIIIMINSNTVTIENIMVSVNGATEFVDYAGGEEYTPLEDGTVAGLPSLAPNMTLLADTAGVTIDCTYNRDSNAVYAELLAKIAALSGAN